MEQSIKISEPVNSTCIAAGASRAALPGGPKGPAPATPGRNTQPASADGFGKQLPNQGFDAARIKEIRLAIRDGRFLVDAGMVADRLLASGHWALRKPH